MRTPCILFKCMLRDRIDVSSFSDVSRLLDISSVNVENVLPSNHDLEALKDNIPFSMPYSS